MSLLYRMICSCQDQHKKIHRPEFERTEWFPLQLNLRFRRYPTLHRMTPHRLHQKNRANKANKANKVVLLKTSLMLDVRGHVWRTFRQDSKLTLNLWRRTERPFIINLTLKDQILLHVPLQTKKDLQKSRRKFKLIKWR